MDFNEIKKNKVKNFLIENCLYGSLLKEYGKKQTNSELLLKTGYPELDSKIMGLLPENIVIIGARSHVGKTTFLANILKNTSTQLKEKEIILFFSLEESRSKIAMRLFALFKNAKLSELNFKGLKGKYSKEDITSGFSNNIIIIDDYQTTPNSIYEICKDLKEIGMKIKGIFIDHLQIFNVYSNENTHKALGDNLMNLKAIGKEFQSVIVLISQIGRDYEKRMLPGLNRTYPPKLSDLKESGNIEQYADLVLFLYNQNTISANGQKGLKILSLNVAKNRNGLNDLNFYIEFWQEQGLMLEVQHKSGGNHD